MGEDLYWCITPPELPEPETNGLSDSFRYLLKKHWNCEYQNELSGRKLTKKDLPELKSMLSISSWIDSEDKDGIVDDLREVIAAIEKHDSITLFIDY